MIWDYEMFQTILKRRRCQQRLTLTQMGIRCRANRVTVWKVENHSHHPQIDTILTFCKGYDLDVVEVLRLCSDQVKKRKSEGELADKVRGN